MSQTVLQKRPGSTQPETTRARHTPAPTFEDDTALVEGCIAHVPGAWDQLVTRFAPLIAVVARRTLRARGLSPSQEDIEDICENTFLAIVRKDHHLLRTYDDAYALSTFLGVVARTQAGRYVRRKRHQTCDIDSVEVAGRQADPAHEVEAHDLHAILRETLDGLSQRDRKILNLFYFSDKDYQTIAEALCVRPNSVGAALHRARSRLRKLLHRRGVRG